VPVVVRVWVLFGLGPVVLAWKPYTHAVVRERALGAPRIVEDAPRRAPTAGPFGRERMARRLRRPGWTAEGQRSDKRRSRSGKMLGRKGGQLHEGTRAVSVTENLAGSRSPDSHERGFGSRVSLRS
jgi:hypothetical protein